MTLHLYFARKFLWTYLGITVIFIIILGLIDMVDELQDFPDLPVWSVAEIVLLNLPHANYEILPLVMILASVALFVRLARSSEMVVVRASGLSGFRGALAPLVVAALVGLVSIAILNPVVAASSKRYHDLVASYSGNGASILALSSEGLWLRQGSAEGQTVIHAVSASADVSTLFDATFIGFSRQGEPVRRIAAERATLGTGEWLLEGVKLWELSGDVNPEAGAQRMDRFTVPSALTRDGIVDSFGKPEYIAIWDLPDFIDQLEQAGFSARRYAVWFQMELAQPIFLMALVMVAAAFTMRHVRTTNTGISVLVAIMLGFSLHYVRNFAQVLGENGQIPVILAAWAPPVASLMLAFGIMLHMEDG
ncbi:LPS export ABC transporter permease LptG [Pelagivirga sediminicola]|uniref:LPS export ABC transporter permease LptG n=1 Tax=Pelagivirga sediminicola TaxID=2170575 RepID=A0A2T7GAL6_9RHOB|nr:LPS export ABC transporter permease LptG [Pelagivirga sediminicola]PVA11467.1 LPS export ABC transporter permease LptG [Pelagivirga sediminicola]